MIFKIGPQLFLQVNIIYVLYPSSVVPIIYVLMQNKSEEAYRRVLTETPHIDPDIYPKTLMCDNEKAFHKVILSQA